MLIEQGLQYRNLNLPVCLFVCFLSIHTHIFNTSSMNINIVDIDFVGFAVDLL